MFGNLNLGLKTLRIFSIIITLVGVIFILLSNYVGVIAIRVTMVVLFLLGILNYKMSKPFATLMEKTYMIAGGIGTIAVFIMPSLTMLIIGVVLLGISVPIIYKVIKTKDFSDKITIAISLAGLIFSIYCILNSSQALNTVIKIIGVAFVILGCIVLFSSIDMQKKNSKLENRMKSRTDEYRFENADEIREDK